MEVVLTTLAATLCMQLGFFCWKLSAAKQPRIGEASSGQVVRWLLRDTRWLAGTVSTMLGWLLFVRATQIGEISVVQPLMSTGDLVLVLLAVCVLGERMGQREWIGLGVTVLGAFGLALGAKPVPGTAAATAPMAALILATAAGAALLIRHARGSRRAEVPLALAVGLAFGTGALLTEAWTAAAPPGARALLHPLLWLMIAANVVGLVLLQTAFQRGRASVIVPVQLAIGNALAVGGGAWLFGETLTAGRMLSVTLILAGAALLQGRVAEPDTPDTRNAPEARDAPDPPSGSKHAEPAPSHLDTVSP